MFGQSPPVFLANSTTTDRAAPETEASTHAGRCGWQRYVSLLPVYYLCTPNYIFNSAVGEQRTVSLKDGTRVELDTNSRALVKLDQDQDARMAILTSDEAVTIILLQWRVAVLPVNASS